MNDLAQTLLTYLINDGYPVVAVVTFAGAVGAPLPVTVLLLAAGAFAYEGELELTFLVPLALGAAVLGDTVGYAAGRWGGHAAIERHGSRIGLTPERLEPICERFNRSGALAVLVTRFLLTPIALPVNLLAGATGYPLPLFVTYASLGELIWVSGYVGLGYVFGTSWQDVVDIVSDSAGTIVPLLLAGGLLYGAFRIYRSRAEPSGSATGPAPAGNTPERGGAPERSTQSRARGFEALELD